MRRTSIYEGFVENRLRLPVVFGLAGGRLLTIPGIRAPRPRMQVKGLRWRLRTRVPSQGTTLSLSGDQTGSLRGGIPMQTSPPLTNRAGGTVDASILVSGGEV